MLIDKIPVVTFPENDPSVVFIQPKLHITDPCTPPNFFRFHNNRPGNEDPPRISSIPLLFVLIRHLPSSINGKKGGTESLRVPELASPEAQLRLQDDIFFPQSLGPFWWDELLKS